MNYSMLFLFSISLYFPLYAGIKEDEKQEELSTELFSKGQSVIIPHLNYARGEIADVVNSGNRYVVRFYNIRYRDFHPFFSEYYVDTDDVIPYCVTTQNEKHEELVPGQRVRVSAQNKKTYVGVIVRKQSSGNNYEVAVQTKAGIKRCRMGKQVIEVLSNYNSKNIESLKNDLWEGETVMFDDLLTHSQKEGTIIKVFRPLHVPLAEIEYDLDLGGRSSQRVRKITPWNHLSF